MSVKNFWDLDTWQCAHNCTIEVYVITKTFPKDERFGITDQLRRASSSIGANIAEGFERYHYKDKIRFYYQARGSIAEVINFLIVSKDLAYVEENIARTLITDLVIVKKMLNGMIHSLQKKI
jgi:four helix bundle protein